MTSCGVIVTLNCYFVVQGKKLCGDKEPLEFIPSGGLGNATGKFTVYTLGTHVGL